jgi:DNA-binding NarL/FixJ family response regulator
VPPARASASEDRWSGTLPHVAAALDAALAAIASPAFVVGAAGEILRSNIAVHAHQALDLERVARSLADVVARRPSEYAWTLTSLGTGVPPAGYLAVLRPQASCGDEEAQFQAARIHWRLTARQTEVLSWAARGLTNASIASSLRISQGTVEFHLSAIFDKAGVDNRATLIARMRDL